MVRESRDGILREAGDSVRGEARLEEELVGVEAGIYVLLLGM